MKIVLLGIQGSGKSTQGNLLSKQLRIPYLSTGHIFRQIAKEKTRLGRYIKETVNAGLLVPDKKTVEIVDNYLSRPEYKHGYILDGFPRTLKQARSFRNHIDKVIFLDIPEKEALWRLVYRNDSTREDETLVAIKKRIDLFYKYTLPVVDYYRKKGILVEIDGTKSIQEVNDEILKSLGKQIKRNKLISWRQKKKILFAIVGLPGAGKTEAASYFKIKGLPVISFGKIINEHIQKKDLPHTVEIHKKIALDFRGKFGEAALAILNEEKIKESFSKKNIVIIEGLRSWEEYLYLKEKFPKVKIYILTIYADKELRWQRIAKRLERKGLTGEERDLHELINLNMAPTIAFCDFLIKNNFSKEEFYDKLEEVYRIIYFS
jgi:adenylate kinase